MGSGHEPPAADPPRCLSACSPGSTPAPELSARPQARSAERECHPRSQPAIFNATKKQAIFHLSLHPGLPFTWTGSELRQPPAQRCWHPMCAAPKPGSKGDCCVQDLQQRGSPCPWGWERSLSCSFSLFPSPFSLFFPFPFSLFPFPFSFSLLPFPYSLFFTYLLHPFFFIPYALFLIPYSYASFLLNIPYFLSPHFLFSLLLMLYPLLPSPYFSCLIPYPLLLILML